MNDDRAPQLKAGVGHLSFFKGELIVADEKPLNFGDAVLRSIAPARIPEISIPKNYNLASEFHSRLELVLGSYPSGKQSSSISDDIGYWNPSLISFQGRTDDGQPVELIQHVSQISILLMKLKRPDPSKPKRKIGFGVSANETEKADA